MSSRVDAINTSKDTWRIASDLLQEHGLRLNKLELERLLAPEVVLVNDLRSDAECRDFRQALGMALDPSDGFQASQREIYCTPVFGNYGEVAYWMIVLNGSPPKGAVLVRADVPPDPFSSALLDPFQPGHPHPIFVNVQGMPRRIILRRNETTARALRQLLTLLHAQLPGRSLMAPCVFEVRKDGRVARAS